MGRSKFPGKPSKIGNRKRVNLSSCALPEDNDSSKAAEKIYLGLSHFNETFGDNEMAAPGPFLGFTFSEVEEAMAEARIQQRESEAEHKKQGIALDLYKDFQNELFSISNFKRTGMTNGEVNKRKLFDGGGPSNKDKLSSSNDNSDDKPCSSRISNLESPKKYNSLRKQSDSVAAARKILEKAKSNNSDRKFILPSRSSHSSRVIKPNKRFLEDDAGKHGKLLRSRSIIDGNLSKKPKVILDNKPIQELRIDVSSVENKKRLPSRTSKMLSKKSQESPKSTSSSGKIILREARLQLDNSNNLSLMEGPFSSPNASSLSPNSQLKMNPIQSSSTPCTLVCGMCGTVRLHLKEKFGILCCESCQKFISKLKRMYNAQETIQLECSTGGLCQYWNVKRVDSIKCQACWLKKCLKNSKLPWELKEKLSKLLPSSMQVSNGFDSPSILNKDISNKFVLGDSNVKDFKWFHEASSSTSSKSAVNENEYEKSKSPESSTNSNGNSTRTLRRRTMHNKKRTKFLKHTGKKKILRQRVDLKGPRVKHVCRSASIVLGQPLATFPSESSPSKKQSINPDTNVDDCKSCDKFDTTNGCTESQGVVVDKTSNNNKSLVVAEGKTGNNEKKSNGKTMPNLKTVQNGGSNKTKKKTNCSEAPENLVSMDFWESYDPDEVCETGFGLIGSEQFTVRALCFLCGSSGQEKLIHCASCCEPYHEFCINDGQIKPQDNAWRFDWVCPRCTVCATCGKTSGQQLKCIKCDNSYHTECVNRVRGRLLHSPDRPWICSVCLRCKSCNAVDVSVFVGNLPLCKGCFKLRKKGNFCPLCQRCYEDDDFDCKMMECGECKKWVHAKCEGLSDERYQVLSDLPDESVEYICRMCCVLPPAPWWRAVESELRSGYLDVLKTLSKNRKACTMLKWSPKKQCTCQQEEAKPETEAEPDDNKMKPAAITERKTSIEVIHHPTESLKLTLKINKEGEDDRRMRKSMEDDNLSISSDFHEDSRMDELKYKPTMSSPLNPPSDSGIGSADDELKTTDDEMNKKSNSVSFFGDKQECICFLEVDSYSSRSKPFSPNLLSIKKKVTECEYSSLRQFHQDMQRMIETTQSSDLMDFYYQTLKATFPWFDPKFCRVSSQKMSPSTSQDSTPNATPIKNGRIEDCRIPKDKLYDQPVDYYYNDFTVEDNRMCLLCKGIGDGPPNDTGRLLYCGQNEWVHCNCALWSGEVFEEIDGSLQNVHSAINRGRSIRCPECNLKGASVGCCAKNCQETYHFKCARKIGCAFMDDKSVYCPFHCNESVGKSVQNERDFEIRRPVYVELDKRKMKTVESNKIKFAVGGLKIESLGRFVVRLSDTAEAIVPAEFQCSRWFWSCYEPWRIVRYHFTIRLVELENDDGIDLGLNLTVDHSKERELVDAKLKQLRYFQQHNKFLEILEEKLQPEKRKLNESPKPEKKSKKEHKVVRKIFDEKEDENNLSDNQNTADLLPPELENEILKDLPNDILDGISMQDIFMDINKNDAFDNNEEIEEISNDNKKIPGEFWANLSDAVDELLQKTSKRSKSEVLPKKTKNHQRTCSLNWNCKMDGNNSKWKRGSKYNVTVNLLEPQGNMLQEIKFTDGSVKELTRRLVQDEGKENKCLPWHTRLQPRLLQVDGGVDSSSSGSEAGESPQRLIDLPSSQSQNYFENKPTTSYHNPDNYFSDSPVPQIDGNDDSDLEDRLGSFKINQLDGTVDSDNEDDLPLPCNNTTDEKPVTCTQCRCTYRTKSSYQRHLENCRNDFMFSSSEGESEEEKPPEIPPAKPPAPLKIASPPKPESRKEKPKPRATYTKRKLVQKNFPIVKNSQPVQQIVLQQPPALIVQDLAPPVVPTTFIDPNPIQYVPQRHIIAAPGPLPGTFQLQEPQFILPQNPIQPGIIIQPTMPTPQPQIVMANDPGVILGSTPMFELIQDPQTGGMFLASHNQPVFYNTETIVSNTVMQTNQFISNVMATSSYSQSTQVFQTSKVEQVVNVQPSNYVIVNQDSKIMTSNDIICLPPMMPNQSIQMNQASQMMQRFQPPEQKIPPQMSTLRCIRPQQKVQMVTTTTPIKPVQTRPVVKSSPMMRPSVTKTVPKTYEKAVITPKSAPRPHQTSRALIDFINNFKSDDYQLPAQPEIQETTMPPPVRIEPPNPSPPKPSPPKPSPPKPPEPTPTGKPVLLRHEWEAPKRSPQPPKHPQPRISMDMPTLDDPPPPPEPIKIEILPLQDNFQAININVPKKTPPEKTEESVLISKSITISPRLIPPTPKKDVPTENFICEVKQDEKGPKLVIDAKSDDGFQVASSTIKEVWERICNSAQKMRNTLKLPQLPVSRKGHEFLGMENHGLQFLLEQLRGAEHSVVYKHRYFPKQASQKTDEESLVKENPSGCARSEMFSKRKEYDMFAWLASKYRKLPKCRVSDEALAVVCNKRANNLPLAMQYRYLKDTWKFYVGVYKSKIHGRGLFCLREIEAGEMVIEYAGELIRSNVTDKREKFYTDKGIGCCYMFRIDDHFVVDATMKGNAARFINHSCEPNCYSKVVDILGKKHIVIFALRKINVMEELTYDYKFPFEDEKISCHCTSKKCRKYLN